MRNATTFHRRIVPAAAAAGLSALFLAAGCASQGLRAAPAPATAGTTVTEEVPMSKGTPGIDNAGKTDSPSGKGEGRAIPIGKIPKPGDRPAATPQDAEPRQ